MHPLILHIYLFLFSATALSQITITTHITKTHPKGSFLIHTIDINSNGNIDFVSVSRRREGEFHFDESIWSEELMIPTEHLYSLLVVDVDGDEDLDMVSGENQDGNIQWHHNNEGEFTTHTINRDRFKQTY